MPPQSPRTPRRGTPLRATPSRVIRCLAFSAIAAGAPVAAGGQAPASLEAGSRVRLTAPSLGLEQAVGVLDRTTDESLVVRFVRPRGAERVETVPRRHVTELAVSTGQRSRAAKWAGGGLLLGAIAGAAGGLASGSNDGFFSRGELAAAGAMLGGLFGGAFGLVMGALNPEDVWAPVPAGGPAPVVGLRLGVMVRLR